MDDVLFWDRHTGGHVRAGPVMQSLPMLMQPCLPGLRMEAIDYRPGLVALVREHACGWREMTSEERRECDLHLRVLGQGGK